MPVLGGDVQHECRNVGLLKRHVRFESTLATNEVIFAVRICPRPDCDGPLQTDVRDVGNDLGELRSVSGPWVDYVDLVDRNDLDHRHAATSMRTSAAIPKKYSS